MNSVGRSESEYAAEPREAPLSPGCPNCGTPRAGRFCGACGQDNARERLAVRPMLGDALQNLVGWESTLARTLRGLVRAPAEVVQDYAAGRRQRYVSPARFCLLALAAWLLLARALEVDPLRMSGIRFSGGQGEPTELADRIQAFLVRHLELLLYVALPLRAWLFRLFFRRSGRNAAESLVLVLYLAGFSYLLGIGVTLLQAFDQSWSGPLRLAWTLLWTVRAARGFYAFGWVATVWRVLVVVALHMLGTALLFAVVVAGWILVTGGG